MKTQISSPCCELDIKPDPSERFVWESRVHLQIYVVLKDFYRQKKNYVKDG